MRLKLVVRDAIAAVLGAIPLRLLNPLRSVYSQSKKHSLRYKTLTLILGVLRYRRLDSDIETFELPDNPSRRFVNNNSILTRKIYWFGERGYEGSEVYFWRYFCQRALKILEIGANTGYYTTQGALAAPDTRYLAVEPHRASVETLRQNLALNAVRNVEVVEAAVVGHKVSERMELVIPDVDHDEAPTGAFLARGTEGISRTAAKSISVPLVEAIDLADNVDLLKLDVEGYEYEILHSLASYIKSNTPTIFAEVLRRTPKLRGILVEMCQNHGYRPFGVGPNQLHPISLDQLARDVLGNVFSSRDIVLMSPRFDPLALEVKSS